MTRYDSTKHHRRSIRLRRYDYARSGAYFVTICTLNRECALGQIENDVTVLSESGRVAEACWHLLPHHFPNVELDKFVVMPNHLHGILVIIDPVGAQHAAPLQERRNVAPGSVGAIIRSFKSATTQRINKMRDTRGLPVWQRNYYEHIIRHEGELNQIRKYIVENPLKWKLDENHPQRLGQRNHSKRSSAN